MPVPPKYSFSSIQKSLSLLTCLIFLSFPAAARQINRAGPALISFAVSLSGRRKLSRFAFVVALACGLSAETVNQSPKDAAGITVLTKMMTQSGWQPNSAPKDVLATGAIAFGADPSMELTFKLRGRDQLRTELKTSHGLRTTTVNGFIKAFKNEKGVKVIRTHAT